MRSAKGVGTFTGLAERPEHTYPNSSERGAEGGPLSLCLSRSREHGAEALAGGESRPSSEPPGQRGRVDGHGDFGGA